MSDYIRLNEPPHWCIQYPTCSACDVDLMTDGDGWLCPACGTLWGMQANDGDKGTLYADWSGEKSTGPRVSNDEAYKWGEYRERMERHRLLPGIIQEPERPREDRG